PGSVPVLLQLLRRGPEPAMAKAILSALQQFDDPAVGRSVASEIPQFAPELAQTAFALLSSRAPWAAVLLEEIDAGKLAKAAVPQDAVRRLKLYSEPQVAELYRKHWGQERVPTTAEMQSKIHQFTTTVQGGAGSPYEGQKGFTMTCAVCHKLFGQGGQIGPDLTAYKRDDLDVMLLNIVNPSAEIREGFENYLLTTKDGRNL